MAACNRIVPVRRPVAFAALALLLCVAAAGPARAQLVDNLWIGLAGASYHVASNWSLNRVPQANDDAISNAGTLVASLPNQGSLGSAGRVSFSGSLSVTGGSLRLGGTDSFVRQLTTISGGALLVSGGVEFGERSNVDTGMAWSGGQLTGAGTVRLFGVSSITGANKSLGVRLEVEDTLVYAGGNLDFVGIGRDQIYIAPNGRWIDNAGSSTGHQIGNVNSEIALVNSGLYVKSGSALTAIPVMENVGRLRVDQGSMLIQRLRNGTQSLEDPAQPNALALVGGQYVVSGTPAGVTRLRIGIDAGKTITENRSTIELAGNARFETAAGVSILDNVNSNVGVISLSGANVTTTTGMTNTGTVRAADGTTLEIFGTYRNVGGTTTLSQASRLVASAVSINGGRVEGSGTIDTITGVRLIEGVVAPGGTGAVGRLEIVGDYEQRALGELAIDIAGNQPGEWDVLAVSGIAQLGGFLKLNFQFAPNVGDRFAILSAGDLRGVFAALEVTGPQALSPTFMVAGSSAAQSFDVRLDYDYGAGILSVAIDAVSAPIPEPGTWALWLTAACAGLARRAQQRLRHANT